MLGRIDKKHFRWLREREREKGTDVIKTEWLRSAETRTHRFSDRCTDFDISPVNVLIFFFYYTWMTNKRRSNSGKLFCARFQWNSQVRANASGAHSPSAKTQREKKNNVSRLTHFLYTDAFFSHQSLRNRVVVSFDSLFSYLLKILEGSTGNIVVSKGLTISIRTFSSHFRWSFCIQKQTRGNSRMFVNANEICTTRNPTANNKPIVLSKRSNVWKSNDPTFYTCILYRVSWSLDGFRFIALFYYLSLSLSLSVSRD